MLTRSELGTQNNRVKTLFQDWLDGHFKKNTREEVAVFVSDNVLTPEALRLVRLQEISVLC